MVSIDKKKTHFKLPVGSNPEPAIKFGAILAIVFNAVFEAVCYKKKAITV